MPNVINEFDQGSQSAYCLYIAHCDGSYLFVQHIQYGAFTDYRLNPRHLDAIKNISSLAELVDYAKANSNSKADSKADLYETLYNRNPDDFRESPTPHGYYVDSNNCLMPIPHDAPFCEFCESAQLDDALDGDFCKCDGGQL